MYCILKLVFMEFIAFLHKKGPQNSSEDFRQYLFTKEKKCCIMTLQWKCNGLHSRAEKENDKRIDAFGQTLRLNFDLVKLSQTGRKQ